MARNVDKTTFATNQKNKACDADSATTGLELPKARPTRGARLRLAFSPANHVVNGFDSRPICEANTFAEGIRGLAVPNKPSPYCPGQYKPSKEDLRERKLLFSLKSLQTTLLILSEKSFREKDLVISDIKEQCDIKESAK